MKTITQNKNRLLSDSSYAKTLNTTSMHSLLWHIALYNRVSENDTHLLDSITPNLCSLFVLKNDNIIFQSDSLNYSFEHIQDEINFFYEATYAHQICSKENGSQRVLTVPINNNLLVGLVAPVGMEQMSEVEDRFSHKTYNIQKGYNSVLHSINEIKTIIDSTDPIIIISKSDEQIIAYNEAALIFFDFTQDEILETWIQDINKNYCLASQRIMRIKNRTIANTDCSIVQYSLNQTDKNNNNNITEDLKSQAENLIQLYQNLRNHKDMNSQLLEPKIVEVQKLYQNIIHSYNKEKNKTT